jgi:uncharacterized RDD family membrane protein YckC
MENNLFISNFWTRIGAFMIDLIILGIFGFILGFIFKNFFISLGENAKLIGWFITLAYFSFLNSNYHNGQTFGKKIMNIQVTDIKGHFISLKTSFIRALILTSPFCLNGYKIQGVSALSAVTIIQALLIFGLGSGIIIFYIFNKGTRQSIHDIIAKTYVVQTSRNNQMTMMPPLGKLPFYITSVIFLTILSFNIYNFTNNSKISKLIPVYEKILQQDGISDASVTMELNPLVDSIGTKHFVYTVRIKTNKNLDNIYNPEVNLQNPELKQTVGTFINSKAYETDNDILNVVVISGFDIGIARQNKSFNIYKPIYLWRKTYNQ